jgi:hypothetical protein
MRAPSTVIELQVYYFSLRKYQIVSFRTLTLVSKTFLSEITLLLNSRSHPKNRYLKLIHQTPLWEEVGKMYDRSKERIIGQNYVQDSAFKELKLSL